VVTKRLDPYVLVGKATALISSVELVLETCATLRQIFQGVGKPDLSPTVILLGHGPKSSGYPSRQLLLPNQEIFAAIGARGSTTGKGGKGGARLPPSGSSRTRRPSGVEQPRKRGTENEVH